MTYEPSLRNQMPTDILQVQIIINVQESNCIYKICNLSPRIVWEIISSMMVAHGTI